MAPIRLPAGTGLAVWQGYARGAWMSACPRRVCRAGALVPRPFSASTTRRTAEPSTSVQSPEELRTTTSQDSSHASPVQPVPSQPQEGEGEGASSQELPAGPFPDFPNFRPRSVYEPPKGTMKSYFIGHHRTALASMRIKLASVGLVIECRDLRVPLSSSNPLLEATLMRTRTPKKPKRSPAKGASSDDSGSSPDDKKQKALDKEDDDTTLPGLSGHMPATRERNPLLSVGDTDNRRMRIIVYTKRDLMHRDGAKFAPTDADLDRLAAMDADSADAVIFLSSHTSDAPRWHKKSIGELRTLMKALHQATRAHGERSLTPLYGLVVGMPNSGKSTLLNRLRADGMTDAARRSRAARTGSEAGVTRRLGTPVRILEDTSKVVGNASNHRTYLEDDYAGSSAGENAGLLISDTPGVFMPYVPDAETMVKLALVGSVREGLVMPTALADYLLYRLNKLEPQLYMKPYGIPEPTEDANVLLDAVARRTGKLLKNGVPDQDAAAQHLISSYRHGKIGNFCLDDLSDKTVSEAASMVRSGPPLSLNQAKKREKGLKRQLMAERRSKRAAALTEY